MNRNPAAIYPIYAIKGFRLKEHRAWENLIDRVTGLPATQPEALAFTLLLRRVRALCGRVSEDCDDLSCAICAVDTLARYGGSEQDLLDEFSRTLDEVKEALARQPRLIRKAA